jgi:pimeloyl-ACP methyl ester carboxylesterase
LASAIFLAVPAIALTQTQPNVTKVLDETGMATTLKVPGATLHHEVRGSGPVMLLISGGSADAGVYAGIAGFLAKQYTVVTYDPRGNSRSRVDCPVEDWRLDVHGDDAAHLLDAVGGGAA